MLRLSYLNSTQSPIKLTLLSNPYKKRVGLLPLSIALTFGWLFVIVWGAVSLFALSHSNYWAMVFAGSTLAFSCVLAYMTVRLISDAFRDYILEVTESECVLVTCDRLRKRRDTAMVLLDDVSYGEYYPYGDSACVILHAPYCQMEVPLWPFGERGRDVIDFLTGRGIRVVDVQSDEQIPETIP